MTTIARIPPTTSGAIFPLRSLKTKVTFFTLAIFLIGIWSLALYSSRMLREDMQRLLGEQQFSAVSFMAAQVNQELNDRLRALENVAGSVSPAILSNKAALQKHLEQYPILQSLFNGGTFITRLDGTATASIPLSLERIGVNYMDRDFIVGALTKGKATIGRPVMGKKLLAPVFSIGVPIHDTQGKVIGALAGTTNLGLPNFMDKFTENRYGKSGGFFIVAPKYRLLVTATDKKRVMETLPSSGIIPGLDRLLQGYDGYAVYVNPLGVEVLASGKSIPVAGWSMGAILPTKEAFAPIHAMLQRILLSTISFTLLAGALTWWMISWMLRRQLSPMLAATRTLASLSDTAQPPQPLPITRQDEIGELIGGFNHLLATLEQQGEVLRENEERYRLMYYESQEAITLTNPEKGFIGGNPAAIKLFACQDEEDFISRTPASMSPEYQPDGVLSAEKAQEMMRIAIEEGSNFFEWTHRKADGTDFPATVFLWRVGKSDSRILQATVRDITELKRAEAELVKRTHDLATESFRLKLILETASDGIHILDVDGNLLQYSQSFLIMLGYNQEEAVQLNVKDWDANIPRDQLADTVRALIETSQTFETKHRRKDGTIIDVEINAKGIELDGKSYLYASARDITDRKQTQEALAKVEKLEAIGTLAAGIAHDFNNLLGVMFGYLELSQMEAEKQMQKEIASHLAQARSAFDRARDLTGQLLTFSKGGAPVRKTQSLSDHVRRTISFSLSGSNIAAKFTIPDNIWLSNFDENQLAQVLDNMVINARHVMSQGGVLEVSLRNIPSTEAPDLLPPKDYVCISIHDHGTGIARDHLPRIFEPFFSTKKMGSGLGLATSYSIIRQHDGLIDVDSILGKGTTFHIYLPASSGLLAAVSDDQPQAHQGKGSILIMDDEEMILDVLSLMLENLGYEVVKARHGKEAKETMMKMIEAGKHCVVAILDLTIPSGLGGKEIVYTLRALDSKIKVIASSGYANDPIMSYPSDHGFAGRLTKPYRRSDLIAVLGSALPGAA